MPANDSSNIRIKGLNKADVLAALYNAARPQARGFFHYDSEPMTREKAQQLLDEQKGREYFDYVEGRPLKLDLTSDVIDVSLYDRDNGGDGTALMVIDELRKNKDVNSENIKIIQAEGVLESAKRLEAIPKGSIRREGNWTVVTLGIDDETRKLLKPRVDKAVEEAKKKLKQR